MTDLLHGILDWQSHAAGAVTHHMVADGILHAVAILAGIFILAGWVEQLCKGYRTKHLDDVSNYLMLFVGAGAGLWSVYGIMVSDAFIFVMNLAGVLLIVAVFMMKKAYMRRSAARQKAGA